MLCLPEPDPLAEAMCARDSPPALVVSFDPMLEELLAATFAASCSVVAPASLGSAEPTPVVAVSSHQLSAQELVQLTSPRVGQTDVEIGDDTPTPREAARRLAWFLGSYGSCHWFPPHHGRGRDPGGPCLSDT